MVILGISFDSVEANAAFAEKYSFPFDLLSDTDRATGVAYGATEAGASGGAKRISYLIDEEGNVARAYDNVKAKEHPGQVLEDLG